MRAVLSLMRVFLCSEKVKRNIRFIAHDPAVMPGTDVKDVPRLHHVRPSIRHGACSLPGYHHANVLHLTMGSTRNWGDVLRPFPDGFVCRQASHRSANFDEFELSFFKCPTLTGCLNSL